MRWWYWLLKINQNLSIVAAPMSIPKMNTSTKTLRWAALAALTLATTAAHAGLFNLNYTGSFTSTTTLGGNALGADTPFSMVATFDSSQNYGYYGLSGLGNYQVTALSLTLAGSTYTAIPNSNLTVISSDIKYNSDIFVVGLNFHVNVGPNQQITSLFGTQSDSNFDSTAPSANTYSSWSGSTTSSSGYSLSLVGVTGGLAKMEFGTTTPTASISAAAVPEPAEYAAVTGLALGVFALVQRRRQAAGR